MPDKRRLPADVQAALRRITPVIPATSRREAHFVRWWWVTGALIMLTRRGTTKIVTASK